MSQSQWIAVYLFLGFIVYVTVRGQLPQFRDAIFAGNTGGGSGGSSAGVQKNQTDTQSVGEAGGYGLN